MAADLRRALVILRSCGCAEWGALATFAIGIAVMLLAMAIV